MKRYRLEIFGIVFIVLFTFITLPHDSSADAHTLTVYGPESFIRNTGKPVIVTHTFTVLTSNNACTLKIYNGGMEDSGFKRVSSAVISLNGVQVVEPNEFNQNVELIEKPVTLSAENQLSVEVRGKPGGAITVVIECLEISTMVSVPDVVGMAQATAESAITSANLTVGDIIEVPKVTIPTGLVIDQDPVPGAEVAEGSAVDLMLVQVPIAGADEIIPGIWAGEWEITITYRDATTNDIVAVNETTGVICPDDPIGLALLEGVANEHSYVDRVACSGLALEDSIQAVCTVQGSYDTCDFNGRLQFGMDLMSGDALSGAGAWTLTAAGCDPPLLSEGQTFVILGIRLSPDTAGLCAAPTSSLLQKFLYPLLPFVEALP